MCDDCIKLKEYISYYKHISDEYREDAYRAELESDTLKDELESLTGKMYFISSKEYNGTRSNGIITHIDRI